MDEKCLKIRRHKNTTTLTKEVETEPLCVTFPSIPDCSVPNHTLNLTAWSLRWHLRSHAVELRLHTALAQLYLSDADTLFTPLPDIAARPELWTWKESGDISKKKKQEKKSQSEGGGVTAGLGVVNHGVILCWLPPVSCFVLFPFVVWQFVHHVNRRPS